MATLLQRALELAAQGLPVFPCRANKQPAISKSTGGQGHLDASTDPARIQDLFSHPQARLIGVPTGEASGFDALDIDPKNGGDSWETDNAGRLPETRRHLTPSGGFHWLFRHAPGVRNSRSKIARGVDVRGQGGYVCFPPSTGYTIVSEAPIASWPTWLLEAVIACSDRSELRPKPGNGNGNGHARDPIGSRRLDGFVEAQLANISRAQEGLKHEVLRNTALALGGIMAEAGFSEGQAVDWMLARLPSTVVDWNNAKRTASWGLRTGRLAEIQLEDRPLPPRQSTNGAKRSNGHANGHADGQNQAEEEFDDEIPEYHPRAGLVINPRQWLLGNLLMRENITMLSSPGGIGKTTTAILMALAVITGRDDLLNQHVFEKGKVWIVTGEDDEIEIMRRLRAACIANGLREEDVFPHIVITACRSRPLVLAVADGDGHPMLGPDAAKFEQIIEKHHFGLVILDPLVKTHRLNENNNTAMDFLSTLLNGICYRTGCAMLVSHHSRKANGDDGTSRDQVRGASSLVDSARINLVVRPMTKAEGERYEIPPDDLDTYLRVVDVKRNLARAGKGLWIELKAEPIGNDKVDPRYPVGDIVQAGVAWRPPSLLGDVTRQEIDAVFARLREGPEGESAFSPNPQAGEAWAGEVLIQLARRSRIQATQIIAEWHRTGVWTKSSGATDQRRQRQAMQLNEVHVGRIVAAFGRPPMAQNDP